MKLPVPPNYSIPEDIEDGQTFEELTTYRLDGTSLVPTMLAGVEIPMEDAEDEAVEDMEEEDMEATGPMAGMGERIMGMA